MPADLRRVAEQRLAAHAEPAGADYREAYATLALDGLHDDPQMIARAERFRRAMQRPAWRRWL